MITGNHLRKTAAASDSREERLNGKRNGNFLAVVTGRDRNIWRDMKVGERGCGGSRGGVLLVCRAGLVMTLP